MLVNSSNSANKKTLNNLSMWKVNESVFLMLYSAVSLISKVKFMCYFITMIIKILFYNDGRMNGGIMKLNVVITILM